MRYPIPNSPTDLFQWAKRLITQLERDFAGVGRGQVTLTANAASTTLTDGNIGPTRKVLLMPTTANAAAALATTYIGTIGERTATITHANNAQVDKTFDYAVI